MDTLTARTVGQITDRYRATTLQLSRTEEMLRQARDLEQYAAADALRHLFRATRWCSTPAEGDIVATGRGIEMGKVADDLDATGIDYCYVVRRRSYAPSAYALSMLSAADVSDYDEEEAAFLLLDRHVEAFVLKKDARVGARRLPRTKAFAVVGACDLALHLWDREQVFSRNPRSMPVTIQSLHPAARQFLGV